MANRILMSFCCVSLAVVSVNVNAALWDRGNGLIFDDDLGVTWLQNANLAATETFEVGIINPNGDMVWTTANQWISAMNTVVNSDGSIGYKGFTGWRLPITVQPDNSCSMQDGDIYFGSGCELSEMGHLFKIEGITSASPCSISSPGVCFDNVQDFYYWSGTDYNAALAWSFSFDTGDQSLAFSSSTDYRYHAWAVHDGDIGVVPVPAAAWLFMSGLIGLVGFARRRD